MLDNLKYLYEDIDRHGNVRLYVWRGKGHRKIRIRETFGTPEFRRAYDAALLDTAIEATPDPDITKPGTYRWLCQRYFSESADFKRLAARGRRIRRQAIESTFDEPVSQGSSAIYANAPLQRLSTKAIRVLRDRKIETPEAANARVKYLRRVFAWALAEQIPGVEVNYAKDVPYFKGSDEGFHTWTGPEVEAFKARHPIGTKAHLAFALLLYTGVRRSDVVTLGRQMVRNGWLHFTEAKGRANKPKHREIPMLPELQAVIEASPAGNLTFLVTEYGAPYSEAGFGNWFRDRCDEAGLPQCSAHGLRKVGATIAADSGATEHQLMAIFGWESPKQAAIYTKKANRRKLAGDAMHLLATGKS